MAIELCSDNNSASSNNSSGISPRISFSHDLCLSDIVPIEQHSYRSNSIGSIDFDFCTRKSFDQDSSSADELFSNGKILPTEVKKKIATKQSINDQSIHHPPTTTTTSSSSREEDQNQNQIVAIVEENNNNKQNNSKSSFWRFKRSSSLNCVSGYGRSLCPLPLLSRSNSTGSAVPNNTNNHSMKRVHKQALLKSQSSSPSSTAITTSHHHHQKPPILKKNYGSYGNASVRVNPVLNVPSGNLFGLTSIFGKEKIKKK